MDARVLVAHHDADTVAAIHAALDRREPLALLHAKLPDAEQARQRALVAAARFEPDDAVVLFTSGSTGAARGVVLSRGALDAAAAASWELLGTRANDRWLCPLPLAHAGGLSIIVRTRAAGIEHVLGDWDDRATLMSIVPAQLPALIERARRGETTNLRAILLGGAAAPPGLVESAVAAGLPVLPTYGLTETFGQIATARTPGGPLVPLPRVTIIGGTRGDPEKLRVSGPMLASRYLDGEWISPELVTADLGFVEDGIVHIMGRADDVLISGGENVHPAQVERVVGATPGVREVVAFGVPDETWGQSVAIAVAVDPTFDRAAALARWHSELPPYARPRRLVVGALPRLPSGKLDRRAIRRLPTTAIDYI